MTKAGSGQLTLTGNNLYTGPTTVSAGLLTLNGSNVYTGLTTINGGTLAIGTSGSINGTAGIAVNQGGTLQVTAGTSANQLPASGNVTLTGGNLSYVSASNSAEQAGALLLNPGQNTILVSRNGSSNTPGLSFAAWPAHTTGATVTYGTDAYSTIGFQSGVPSNVNGIVGGYAFFSANGSGVDFATISGSTVRQYTGYTNTDLGTMAAASGSLNLSPTVVQGSVACRRPATRCD